MTEQHAKRPLKLTTDKPGYIGSRPKNCPDCESPLIWTGPSTALCACNGEVYEKAQDEVAAAERERYLANMPHYHAR